MLRNRLDPCSRALAAQDFRHASQQDDESVWPISSYDISSSHIHMYILGMRNKMSCSRPNLSCVRSVTHVTHQTCNIHWALGWGTCTCFGCMTFSLVLGILTNNNTQLTGNSNYIYSCFLLPHRPICNSVLLIHVQDKPIFGNILLPLRSISLCAGSGIWALKFSRSSSVNFL